VAKISPGHTSSQMKAFGEPLHIVVVAGANEQLAINLRRYLSHNVSFPDGRVVWQGRDRNVTYRGLPAIFDVSHTLSLGAVYS